MSKSSLDSTALAAILIAAAAGFLLVPAGLTWLASILGVVLLLILLAFDEEGYRSIPQSVGFAGAAAFCLLLASLIPYQYIYGLPSAREPQLTNKWLPITWALAMLLFCLVDRARMGARIVNVQPGAATLGSVFSPRTAAPAPAPVPAMQYAPPVQYAPQPIRYESPAPMAVPQQVPVEVPTPHLVRNEAPQRLAPPVAPPVEIYVHLTGESLNLMRSVLAEPLGRDYYRIVDTMPENETWQFTPGQVVRCKKQNLSTGKAMVAIEEAPRAQ